MHRVCFYIDITPITDALAEPGLEQVLDLALAKVLGLAKGMDWVME
jgi:hypothetical protein